MVISDRFADSTRAYQGIGLGLGLDLVEEIYRRIAPNFEPDLTLLLDLPVDASLTRMVKRGGEDDRYQQRNVGFHQKLRDAYLDLAKNNATRFRIIDAAQDEPKVAEAIAQAVRERFAL